MFSCTADKTDAEDISSAAYSMSKELPPMLSLGELMSASDVKYGLSEAAKRQDKEALAYWQLQLLTAADEVNMLASERALIEGEQGLTYLEFQGMKTNYQQEFEIAFFEFGDVSAVYQKYPAFENLHAQSRELVDKRDMLINSVADELKQQGFEGDTQQEARQQWQNYALENMREELPSTIN
jgi:hypothetical protein